MLNLFEEKEKSPFQIYFFFNENKINSPIFETGIPMVFIPT